MCMIHIKIKQVEDIPYLAVEKVDTANQPLPTIVYYHGFNGGKEDSLTIAYKLAQKGVRVILPDCLMHGERKENASQTEIELAFWDIVLQNVKELNIIKEHLQSNNLIADGLIGLGGTSMGGITATAALTQYDWIKVAAVVMGTPNLLDYAAVLIQEFNKINKQQISSQQKDEVISQLRHYDLSLRPELINNRPLLFWHGENDNVIPIQYTLQFYKKNKSNNDTNLEFIKESGRAHNVSRIAVSETVRWLSDHLRMK